MREITLHPQLLIPVVISFLCLLLLFYKRKGVITKTNDSVFISLVFFFLFYLIIVGRAFYLDICFQVELNKLDLNNDGFFTGKEITEKQQLVMKTLISDVGRNFSFIVGFIFSLILSIFIFLISSLVARIRKQNNH